MNIAITFHSEEYLEYIEERVNTEYSDTLLDYNGVRLLQDIARDLVNVFHETIVPNSVNRVDLLDDDDAMVRLLGQLLCRVEKFYTEAIVIGFYPIDLKGNMLVILNLPSGGVFNISCLR